MIMNVAKTPGVWVCYHLSALTSRLLPNFAMVRVLVSFRLCVKSTSWKSAPTRSVAVWLSSRLSGTFLRPRFSPPQYTH